MTSSDYKMDTIGILGLGYVGIPLALRISQVGKKVLGFDIDKTKVESLNGGGKPNQAIF